MIKLNIDGDCCYYYIIYFCIVVIGTMLHFPSSVKYAIPVVSFTCSTGIIYANRKFERPAFF